MKNLFKGIWLFPVMVLSGCFEKDIFPDTPRIEFEEISFIDTETTDSLVLTFTFEDGGGDVGLGNGRDLLVPYEIYDVIIDSDDSTVTISQDISTINLPLFKAPVLIDQENGELAYFFFPEEKVPFSDTDNRPAYSCDSYEIIETDTFYIARNEFHYNFHIEFQRKINDSYEVINFREIFNNPDCSLGNFNGRIPYYDPEGKSGTITYSMLSQAFRLAFLDDVIRVKFYIYDRALNKSNEVFSPDFILADITQ
ncbi:hypothetical protein [Ekhidna sp.]|uniref:hypothetical protein n=1 Tax=Ekhidna sp. TaxID=2608089 RepID=UPI003517EA8E